VYYAQAPTSGRAKNIFLIVGGKKCAALFAADAAIVSHRLELHPDARMISKGASKMAEPVREPFNTNPMVKRLNTSNESMVD
jgi:hypothetical protein